MIMTEKILGEAYAICGPNCPAYIAHPNAISKEEDICYYENPEAPITVSLGDRCCINWNWIPGERLAALERMRKKT